MTWSGGEQLAQTHFIKVELLGSNLQPYDRESDAIMPRKIKPVKQKICERKKTKAKV